MPRFLRRLTQPGFYTSPHSVSRYRNMAATHMFGGGILLVIGIVLTATCIFRFLIGP